MRIKIHDFIVSGALNSIYATKNPKVLEWINQDLDTMIEYYKHVYSMEQRLQLARVRMDLEAYQDRVVELDRQRREKHDAAISGIKDLDSCCQQCGFGSCVNVADLDACDRSDIADAIFDFCDKWVKRNK